MGGGLIQLAARGAQDFNLIGNPQISFFKIVYRRYTNFSMETIKLAIEGGNINNSTKELLTCEIKRDADLISNMYFTFELPEIYSGASDTNIPYEFKWIENIGTNIIDSIDLFIGGSLINKHTGMFMNVLSELKYNETQKKLYKELIGHVPEVYDPSIKGFNKDIYVPVITYAGATNSITSISSDNLYNAYYYVHSNNYYGTTAASSNTTITLDGNANTTTDFYRNYYISVLSGTTVYVRKITGSTTAGVLTVDSAWDTNPVNTDKYVITPTNFTSIKVRIKRDTTNNNLSTIEILDFSGHLIDQTEFFVDINNQGLFYNVETRNNPRFIILKSNYPHIKETNGTQFNSQSCNLYNNIQKNSDLKPFSGLIPSIQTRKIKVPINFFCNDDTGVALPLLCLQYHEVEVKITLKTLNDLFTIVKSKNDSNNIFLSTENLLRHKDTSINLNTFTVNETINFKFGFEGNYIYLDTEERTRFATNSNNYLMTEVSERKFTDQINSNRHELIFNHPVKELIVIAQRTDMKYINKWNNYTNWVYEDVHPASYEYLENKRHYYNAIESKYVFYNKHFDKSKVNDTNRNYLNKFFRKNIIHSMALFFNSNFRQNTNDHMFYGKIQPFQHHKTNPKDGINVYSFSLNPHDYQPSGACNFSRIGNVQLEVNFDENQTTVTVPQNKNDNVYEYKYDIHVYAISYNVLQISSGMGAKQYAN